MHGFPLVKQIFTYYIEATYNEHKAYDQNYLERVSTLGHRSFKRTNTNVIRVNKARWRKFENCRKTHIVPCWHIINVKRQNYCPCRVAINVLVRKYRVKRCIVLGCAVVTELKAEKVAFRQIVISVPSSDFSF